MESIPSLKRCPKCGNEYPKTHEYFHRSKNRKDGLNPWCKPCQRLSSQKVFHRRYYTDPVYRAAQITKSTVYNKTHPEMQRAGTRKWYYSHREAAKERVRCDAIALRKLVLEHYGGKCACCGETRYEFLAIDHINGDGRIHRRSVPGSRICRWLRKNNFPEGFRILCHNCNQSLGHYGYCPHQK